GGRWGRVMEVRGWGALNAGGNGSVSAVSCASAGNCAAGGSYRDSSAGFQAFVVSETNGTWGTAIEVPGLGALNAGGFAGVNSVSCRSAGKCAAGGTYTDGSRHIQAFVAGPAQRPALRRPRGPFLPVTIYSPCLGSARP